MDELLDKLQSLQIPDAVETVSRNDEQIEIILCRYESGKIVKKLFDPTTIDFVAISHVWGQADWQRLGLLEDDCLVSKEKARFIVDRLQSVVGEQWFWMDVICVDQRNADARVAVTQHIPMIFRFAKETVVIKGSSGFKDCCVQAAGNIQSEFYQKGSWARSKADEGEDDPPDVIDGPDGRLKLRNHLYDDHEDENIEEGVLTRLWPLQEIILSDTLQFVQCDSVPGDVPAPIATIPPHHITTPSALVQSLSILGTNWSTYGTGGTDYTWYRTGTGKTDFVEAFFNNGTASRGQRDPRKVPDPRAQDILQHMTSTRHTSKGRDFILAIFPQFGFYRVPAGARKMTFSELFNDCCRQIRSLDNRLAPLLTHSPNTMDGQIDEVPLEIPEPTCLGDMAKLFNGPVLRKEPLLTLDIVQASPIAKLMARPPPGFSEEETAAIEPQTKQIGIIVTSLHMIVRTIFNSTSLWLTSRDELIHEYHRLSEGTQAGFEDRMDTMRAFTHIIRSIDFDKNSYDNAVKLTYDRQLLEMLFPVPWEVAITYACMISCGLGVSAFEWVREHMEPMTLVVNQVSHMALAPKKVVDQETTFFFRQVQDFLMGRDGPMGRVCLLAIDSAKVEEDAKAGSGSEGREQPKKADIFRQCLFPPDSKFKGSREY